MKIQVQGKPNEVHEITLPESIDKMVEAATELFKAITQKLKEE